MILVRCAAALVLLGISACGELPDVFDDGLDGGAAGAPGLSSGGGGPAPAGGGDGGGLESGRSGVGGGAGGEMGGHGGRDGGEGGSRVSCGDAVCDGDEGCRACPQDCGPCAPVCGDAVCSGPEDCQSCADDCGPCAPVCGDAVCSGAESCSSCQVDCGGCPPLCGDAICDAGELCVADCGCAVHTDCGSTEICVQQACESAFGRDYLFTVVSASLPTNIPMTLSPWDPIGPPDPYVELCTAFACPSATTTVKADTSTPFWNETFVVHFPTNATGTFVFRMWDEDFQLDDFALMTSIGTPSEWVDVVRTGNGIYTEQPSFGLMLDVEIEPI